MKCFRLVNILLSLVLCFALTSCGGNAESEQTTKTTGTATSSDAENNAASDSADIDITDFSGTMAYAEISNMQSSPDDYIGKIVRMDGSFATYEENDATYFLCIVEDAKACCSIGMEFVLEGDHSYPEDYPELFSDITVTGEFQTYERAGEVYCNLENAVIE